jgi:glycine/D-amino acid oxidase-like deaminating enzyme
MSNQLIQIPSDDKLPAAADVVVIGGGIIGVTATYFLARQGLSVALIEKGQVAGEQSSRNWGWCRQQNRDARELPVSGTSMRLWDELMAETGHDLGFRRCGLHYATDDPKQLAEWEAWREVAQQFGVNTRMLSGEEAAELIPTSGRSWLGGVHSIDDGKAEPALAAPLIAEGARARGATIHQNCVALGLDVTNGAVSGVITERGTIRADAVLCAAGAWASAFCRSHGIRFPQSNVRQTALRTGPAPDVGGAIYTPDCTLTRRLDGSYTIAVSGKARIEITPQAIRFAREFMPMFKRRFRNVTFGVGRSFFEGPDAFGGWQGEKIIARDHLRVISPESDHGAASAVLEKVRNLFPALANVQMAEEWGSYVDCTPDSVPVISPVDSVAGFYLAAGCSGHGFGLGPGLGMLAAQLVANDTPYVDTTPFRLSRLVDGSKMDVGAI